MSLNVNEDGVMKEIAIDKSTVNKLKLSFIAKVLHTQEIRNAHKTVASLGITKVKLVDTATGYNYESNIDKYTYPKTTNLSDIESEYIVTLQEGDLPFYPPLPCKVSSYWVGSSTVNSIRYLTEKNFCSNFPFRESKIFSNLIYFKDCANTATGGLNYSDWNITTNIYIVFDTPQHYRIVAYAIRTSSKSEYQALRSHLYYGTSTYYTSSAGELNSIGVSADYRFEPELYESYKYSNTDILV